MRLDTAAFKCGIVRWKVAFAPGAMTVVIAVGSAARATAASITRKVDTGTTAGEGKSATVARSTRWASPSARSAQIRGAVSVCVFITAGPSTKLFTWGGGDMGGHVLRETTSRGLCGLVCPSRTSERGGEGDCVKGGGGEEGKCERERALERLQCYSPGH
jgi:hypothetical protein